LCRLWSATEGISISPDGSRLAFMTEILVGPQKVRWVLMTVAAEGGEPEKLYESEVWIHDPIWSKNGHRLFFIDPAPRPRSEMMSISAEGGEPQRLGIGLQDLFFLELHPDGTQVAFNNWRGEDQLWVLKNLFPAAKASR
jgi:Tol biopolymer transport system component